MAKSLEQIRQQASVIRDEKQAGANTARRIGQMFIDLADFTQAEIEKIPSGGGGDNKKDLLLSVSSNVVYSDRPTKVSATATLKNAREIISIQFDRSMVVAVSQEPVSTFSTSASIKGSETVRASCQRSAEQLEKVVQITSVSPIFFGCATHANELTNEQVASPRTNPRGEYSATILQGRSMCFLIPREMGELDLNKVTWNGFLFPLTSVGEVDYTLKDGSSHRYYQYESGAFNEQTDVLIKIE